MQNITIRHAEEKDCERILALITELAVYEKEPEAVTVSLDHFKQSGFGAKPIWTAFVAEVNGQIEGFALLYIRYSTWKGQMLYLEDFYVTQAMRKHGLGKMLFDRVLAYGKEEGHCGITWQVLDWNQVAIDFYNKYPTIFDKEWWNGKIFF
jgi:GNAT superfamily N-acetyltransferase